MHRSSRLIALLVTTFLCVPGGAATRAGNTASTNSEVATIYKVFLSRWSGKAGEPRNLAKSAYAPSADDMKQYADCAKEIGKPHTRWVAGSAIPDLHAVLGNSPSLHFVDPKAWRPLDPGALMANGASVGPAVSAGMAQALITLSAITFNKAHDIAVFNFSFVCGSLCGTGSIVVLQKTQNGWVQSKTRCGSWQA
jgi:hypothetical protein